MLNKIFVQKLLEDLNSNDCFVRKAAIYALGKIGGEDIVDNLIQCLSDREKIVRISAIKVLLETNSSKIIVPLIEKLKNKNEELEVRLEVIKSLSNINSEKVINALIDTLNDWNEEIRISSAVTLGKLTGKLATPYLIPLLHDKSCKVRSKVALTLGEIKDNKAVKALVELLKVNYLVGSWGYNDLESVKIDVITALGKIGSDEVIPALIESLVDKSHKIRKYSIIALREIGNSKFTEYIIDRLWDEDTEVRKEAIFTISVIGDLNTLEQLLTILEYGYSNKQEIILKVFSDLISNIKVENKIEEISKLEKIIFRTKKLGIPDNYLKQLYDLFDKISRNLKDISLNNTEEVESKDIVIFEEE